MIHPQLVVVGGKYLVVLAFIFLSDYSCGGALNRNCGGVGRFPSWGVGDAIRMEKWGNGRLNEHGNATPVLV